MLTSKFHTASGSIIYLISDGINNEGDLTAALDLAIKAGVTIHTVAISQSADSRLEEISKKTGGKTYSYLEILNGSVGLAASFLEASSGSVTALNSAPATVSKYHLLTSFTS